MLSVNSPFLDQFQEGSDSAPLGPGGLLGVEQEFEVYRSGRQQDFRRIIHSLRDSSGLRTFPAGPYGYLVELGPLIICDGWEAEIATTPTPATPGVASYLSALTQHNSQILLNSLENYNQHHSLKGYSTHLSAYCTVADEDTVCRTYVCAMAPAMMLLMDLPVSPGLLVRPRRRRFEIGGEYVLPGPHLIAAVLFFLGSYLAVWDAVVRDERERLPLWFSNKNIELATQRWGYYAARTAFGDDLYAKGRQSRLILEDGKTITAQQVLELTWETIRPYLQPFAHSEETAIVDALISGSMQLPLEQTDTDRYLKLVRKPGPRPPEPLLSQAFQSFFRTHRGKNYTMIPHLLTWDFAVFSIQSRERSVFVNVPRRFWSRFKQLLNDDSLSAILERTAIAANSVLSSLSDAESPGLTAKVNNAALGQSFNAYSSLKKKKPPERCRDDACQVRKLAEGLGERAPVIEICLPATRDPLRLSPLHKQEPAINAVMGALSIYLQSGAFQFLEQHLNTRAVGIDFELCFTYRSSIFYNGIGGHRWDHNYNKRVVPTKGEQFRITDFGWCEIYSGEDGPRGGDLTFYDGSGRLVRNAFKNWNHRTVRKCGFSGLADFKAVVTTYEMNPGERFEIQRFAVYEGPLIFGEAVFYIAHYKDGSELIFNCFGYLIAIRDANLNIMRFFYGLPWNPATGFLVLRKIVDSSGRSYALDYAEKGGALRLIELAAEDGRKVTFIHNDDGELTDVLAPSGRHPENRSSYQYEGSPGLLVRLFEPNQAPGGRAIIENVYNDEERVVSQRVGDFTSTIAYNGETVSSIKDGRKVTTNYKLEPQGDTYVLTEIRVANQQPVVPGFSFTAPAEYVTTYKYNVDFLLSEASFPDGQHESYEYQPQNFSVTAGEEREWLERNVTLINNLAKGNLLKRTETSSDPTLPDIVFEWEYDPRYNEFTVVKGPLGETRYEYGLISCLNPSENANPKIITHPPLLQPDGTRKAHLQKFNYGPGGLIAEYIDPDGVKTTYEYHQSGAIAKMVVDPDNLALTTRIENDDRGNPIEMFDPENNKKTASFDNRDNVLTRTDELEHVTTYFYDRNDNLIRVEETVGDDPAGFTFASGSFTGLSVFTLEYDILNQVTTQTLDPDGLNLRTEFNYDANGKVIEQRRPCSTSSPPEDPDDRTTFEYDSRGQLFKETKAPGSPLESSTFFLYDAGGNNVEVITPRGSQWSYRYNGRAQLVETISPVGTRTLIDRNPAGQPVRIRIFGQLGGPSPTDRSGTGNVLLSEVVTIFDSLYQIVQERVLRFDPRVGQTAGVTRATTSYFRGASGALEEIADAEGRRTVFKYDSSGRLIQTIYPGGHFSETVYTRRGLVESERVVEMPEGSFFFEEPAAIDRTTRYRYDRAGRVTEEDSPLTGKLEFAYDSRGLLRAAKLANGAQQVFLYDAVCRKTSQILEVGPTTFNLRGRISTTIEYNRAGLPVAITGGSGNLTRYQYNALAQAVLITDPDGRTSSADYNAQGQPILVTARNADAIEIAYDALDRPIKRTHRNPAANQISQTLEYDGLGNVTRVIDDDGNQQRVAEIQYDSSVTITKEIQDGLEVGFEHDLTGRLTALRYPSGIELSVDLTPSGRSESLARTGGAVLAQYAYLGYRKAERVVPAVLIDPRDSSLAQFPIVQRNLYNANGQLTSFSHLIRNDITDPTDPVDIFLIRPLRLDYDNAGRLQRKRSPEYAIEYQYDGADRLIKTVADPLFDRVGFRREVISSEFDAGHFQRRSEREVTRTLGGLVKQTIESTPNALNALATRTTTQDGGQPQTKTFTYNRNGSLFESSYEVTSKRLGRTRISGTRRLFYDAFGRLVLVFIESDDPNRPNWRITYRYDGFGRRVERIEEQVQGPANTVLASRMTRYVFWGDRCIEELERATESEPWVSVRRYYHGVSQNELLALDVREDSVLQDINNDGQISGGATLVFLNDHEQTPLALARLEYTGTSFPLIYERYLIDSSGNTDRFLIDEAGNPRLIDASVTGHTIAQHGRWFHEVEGLYYNGRRFYDPDTGTFLVDDRLGRWNDSATLGNGFSYAGGNTALNFDTNGAIAESVFDAASLGIGLYSISQWDENTSTFDKVLDVFGVIVDAIALAIPILPGGVGLGLKSYRAARTLEGARNVYRSFDTVGDAYRVMQLGKKIERGLNAIQAVDLGANAVNSYYHYTQTGSLLSAGLAGLAGVAALRSGLAAYLGVCFTAETEVCTSEGPRSIESINEGDLVMSYDEITGRLIERKVLAKMTGYANELVCIQVLCENGQMETIRTTDNHPFLATARQSWTSAIDLQPGDVLCIEAGSVRVESVEKVTQQVPVVIFNLEVSGTHTFLVSKLGVVVHNLCGFEKVASNLEGGARIRQSAGRLKVLRSATTAAGGQPVTFAELIGLDYAIQRIEVLGYRLIGAVKTRGNQGIDLIFEGTGANKGKFALAEAKASRGRSALKLDTKGIRQGSEEFFLTRLDDAGDAYKEVRDALKAGGGVVELFGAFAGGLEKGKAKLKNKNNDFSKGVLYRFNPLYFKKDVNFRKTPLAAEKIDPV